MVRLVWLECDECQENLHEESERNECGTSAEALAIGRRCGWVKRGKKILCWECKEG
jgi:hypothetical protein